MTPISAVVFTVCITVAFVGYTNYGTDQEGKIIQNLEEEDKQVLLNEPCVSGTDCKDSNTICADVCLCEPGYVEISGTCQTGVPLGGSCEHDEEWCYERCSIGDECLDVGPTAVCIDGICVCEEKAFYAYDVCYTAVLNMSKVNYTEAEDTCSGLASDAHLITVPNEEVALYLRTIIPYNGISAWIGLHEDGNNHKWMTGETAQSDDYLPWMLSNSDSFLDNQKCIYIYLTEEDPEISDAECLYDLPFFCMVPIPKE